MPATPHGAARMRMDPPVSPASTAEGSADPKGSLATRRRCPAVPTRSSLRQVLNAAEDVVADRGGHLILISVFKCPDKRVVLPNRFLVRPPGLRAVRERPP